MNGKSSYKFPGTTATFPGFLIPNAPADTYLAAGKNGQFLSITPSEGLVWIRMGDSPDDLPVPFLLNEQIWEKINDLVCPLSTTDLVKDDWQVFPNPVNSKLTIQSSDTHSYTWELYTHALQFVKQGNQFSSPDFSAYANGLYWVKIQSDKDVIWKKVVKK